MSKVKAVRQSSHHRPKAKDPFWKKLVPWVFALLMVGVVVALIASGGGLSSASPNFDAPGLTGQNVRLDDYRGQVVMLNFWATWCPPCRAEMPTIQAAYTDRQNEGFTVLAINNGETPAQIQPFVQAFGLQFPVVLDENSELARIYGVRSFPTSIFIDAQGEIYAKHTGLVTDTDLQRYIDEGMARTS